MKVIICGAGQVGTQIAQYLSHDDIDVTLVDVDPEQLSKTIDGFNVRGITGSGSYPEILDQAGALDADLLIAVTDLDEINMVTCQVAYSLFNVPTTIARIRHGCYLSPKWSMLFNRDHLPVDVVIRPEQEVAEAIFRRLHVPGSFDMYRLADDLITMVGVRCDRDCPILDTPLQQLVGLFPDLNATIVAIIRDEKLIVPSGQDMILAGDEIYCVVQTDQLNRLMNALGSTEEKIHSVVITGGGNVGLLLAQHIETMAPNISIKIIELGEYRAEEVAQELNNATVLHGDILEPETLEAIHIKPTDTFVAVTDDDEVNILSSLLAKRHGCTKAMALVNISAYRPLLPALGVDVVVSPRDITVSKILQHVRKGRIRAVYSLRDEFGEIIEAEVGESSSLVGVPLCEANLPKGVMIGAIKRDDQIVPGRGQTMLQKKDRVILFSPTGAIKKVEKLFSVSLDYF